MTDNEIIKALECCHKGVLCGNCPMYGTRDCMLKLYKNSLDLINRQKAEIKDLQERNVVLRGAVDGQKAEIERLQEAYKQLEWERDAERRRNLHLSYDLKQAKKETAQKFAKKLTGKFADNDSGLDYVIVSYKYLDGVVKEIGGAGE